MKPYLRALRRDPLNLLGSLSLYDSLVILLFQPLGLHETKGHKGWGQAAVST